MAGVSVRRLLLLAALVSPGASPGAAAAQGTALVVPSDPAYRDLDRLAELGALDSLIVGQRPYSRREVARIARVAGARLVPGPGDSGPMGGRDSEATELVRALIERFGEGGGPQRGAVPAAFDGASLSLTAVTHDRRTLPGPGRDIEATIGPFGQRRLGEAEARGTSAAIEVAQRVEPWPWLALAARQRLELRPARDPGVAPDVSEPSSEAGRRGALELLTAAVRARAGNVAFTVGRSPVAWSQHSRTGLLLAADGPALDHVSISGDRPFRLPGLLGRAGAVQGTVVLANLGASRVRSHSRLLAYKVSAAPTRDIEVGGSFANRFGGAGARDVGFGDRLIDFLPFIDIFRRHNYTDSTRTLEVDSDKMLGLDGRVRLAGLGGLVVSGELLVDDFDVHRLPTLLTWDGSQSVRITAPRLGARNLSLALSAIHTGIRAYSHHELTAGHATRGRLLGDELGPDAKAFGAEATWTAGQRLSLGVEGRTAIHSKAEYRYEVEGTSFALRRLTDASNEQRDRLAAAVLARLAQGRVLAARVGMVRSRNHAFTGLTRHDALAEVSLLVTR